LRLGDEIYLTYLIAVVGLWEEGRGGNYWALCVGFLFAALVCWT
jgi:hypothetical protein